MALEHVDISWGSVRVPLLFGFHCFFPFVAGLVRNVDVGGELSLDEMYPEMLEALKIVWVHTGLTYI